MARAAVVLLAAVTALLVAGEASSSTGRTYVDCGYSKTREFKPGSCDFHFPGVAGRAAPRAVDDFYVNGLHWSAWGGATAVGRGTFRGNMDYHAPVTVYLTDRRTCADGKRFYSRFASKFDGKKRISPVRLDSC